MTSRIALSSSTACVNTNSGLYQNGKALPLAEKLRIVGIFLDLQKQQPTKPVTRRQLATASNCGESSALKIMKEYRDTGVVSDPDDAHISRAHGVGSKCQRQRRVVSRAQNPKGWSSFLFLYTNKKERRLNDKISKSLNCQEGSLSRLGSAVGGWNKCARRQYATTVCDWSFLKKDTKSRQSKLCPRF
jgi:hypothetical protein